MQAKQGFSARLAMTVGLVLLLCAPMAMAQAGRVSIQGHVTGMVADGAGYRVTLDNGGYSYWVPSATITDRNIRVGDYVRFDGYGSSGLVTVDNAAWLGDRYYNQPMYSSVPSAAMMNVVVQSTNRHYNYVNVRDPGTGRHFKVDVRRMDTQNSVNVWRLRPGDRINISGGWESNNTFQADRVYF